MGQRKGFSLIELIVTIAIMAVLTAVLTPALLAYVERSRAQKDDSAMNGTSLNIGEYVCESGGEFWLGSMPSGFTSVCEERESGTGWTEHYYVLKYNGNTVYEGSWPVEYSTDSGPTGYRMTQNGTCTTN